MKNGGAINLCGLPGVPFLRLQRGCNIWKRAHLRQFEAIDLICPRPPVLPLASDPYPGCLRRCGTRGTGSVALWDRNALVEWPRGMSTEAGGPKRAPPEIDAFLIVCYPWKPEWWAGWPSGVRERLAPGAPLYAISVQTTQIKLLFTHNLNQSVSATETELFYYGRGRTALATVVVVEQASVPKPYIHPCSSLNIGTFHGVGHSQHIDLCLHWYTFDGDVSSSLPLSLWLRYCSQCIGRFPSSRCGCSQAVASR